MMKKYLFIAVCLLTMGTTVYAQSFMRYKMKDGAFNGFYTDCVDSISHNVIDGKVVSKVFSNKVCHVIPVDDIVDISFESIIPEVGDLSEYRLYEFDFGDSFFKKAYIDNRSFCYASRTGEFGPNDTQLFTSIFNDVRILILTDEQGRISRYFDGVNYIIMDYKDDGIIDIIDWSEIGNNSIKFTHKQLPVTRAISNDQKTQAILALVGYIGQKECSLGIDFFIRAVNIRNHILDNPELRYQRIFYNTMNIVSDITGVGLAIGLLPETGGFSLVIVAAQLHNLYNDFKNLLEEISPDAEVIERYKQFYADKYGINVFTKPATDVKSTTATLNGFISSGDKLKGQLVFRYSSIFDEIWRKTVDADYKEIVTNQYEASARLSNLSVDAKYYYSLDYICKVDDLQFTYSEDSEFTTLKPRVYTGAVKSKTSTSAVIECEYEMIENAWYGLYYFDDVTYEKFEIAAGGPGNQLVSLTGLEPSRTYRYCAVIDIGDRSFQGSIEQFTTDSPDLSGTWRCTETHYNLAGEPYYTSYFVTLYPDGSVDYSETDNIISSSWSVNVLSKTLDINILELATQTIDSGRRWHGKIDNLKNPTIITGTTNRWNNNQVGYFEGDAVEFQMTK